MRITVKILSWCLYIFTLLEMLLANFQWIMLLLNKDMHYSTYESIGLITTAITLAVVALLFMIVILNFIRKDDKLLIPAKLLKYLLIFCIATVVLCFLIPESFAAYWGLEKGNEDYFMVTRPVFKALIVAFFFGLYERSEGII